MEPRLVVVIDTEEDWFDAWDAPTSVANIAVLPEIQRRCFDPLGVRPTYLITYPVATDEACAAIFRELIAQGRCEVGAHVHNWTSPPFSEHDRREKTYHSRIDPALERQKIADLAGIVADAVGERPVTFKGGRWGASGRTIRHLAELGFTTDTSVCPVTDFRPFQGGPNYLDAPFHAYFPSHADILAPDPHADPTRAVLELPVTVGFAKPDFEGQLALLKRVLGNPLLRGMRAVGILNRLGLLRRIKLSPEQSSVAEMKALVDAALERGHSVLNLTFHSCILALGCSPYSRTPADLEGQLARIDGILEYVVRERGVLPATCREVREAWAREAPARAS